MPPRSNASTNRKRPGSPRAKRGAGATRRHGAGSWLLLWPFHLIHWLTRGFIWPLRWGFRLIGYPAILGALVLVPLAVIYGLRAQRYDLAKVHEMPERSIVIDRHGRELGRIHGEKRSIVPLGQVSEHFRKAILAREDERFYQHGAVDLIGIVRAAIMNLSGKRQGASTITQQLASDIFQLKRGEKRGDRVRQFDRKFLEMAIAHRLELALSKDEILETYINQINWGRQIKGIGEASRIYFEKHPAELNLSESALLAGIVRGPDAYNPFRSMEAAIRERDTTLRRMVDAGVITQADADTAMKEVPKVRPVGRRNSSESYAMNAIRQDLEIILEQEDIQLGGLKITTTIDQRIQTKAEEALDKRLSEVERIPGYAHPLRATWKSTPNHEEQEPKYLQGAAVVIENRSGAVLAVVGGRDVRESRFNRAKDAQRQIGSIFKPFVYLAAFDKGMSPDTPISDGPIQPGEIKNGRGWNPQNSDGKFGGVFPAAYGLVRSRNTMSVRVGDYAGMARVQHVAKRAGFNREVPGVPASFLGTWEATPWEVATGYSIFPNEGTRFRPYLISEIRDRDDNLLYSTLPLSYQAASRKSAREVSGILEQVAISGTAASVKRHGFTKPCAGKTGTTNDFKDAWFAGYTSQLTCAVWVGFDRPKKTLSGGYGSFLALPVWAEIMKTADQLDYRAGRLHDHANQVPADVCRLSGKRATTGCHAVDTDSTAWFGTDTVLLENDFCPLHPARALAIDPKTGQPLAPKAKPVLAPETPQRAILIEPKPQRAIPVEALPQRAIPVEPTPRRAVPVEEIPPRAQPVR